MIRRPPRRAFNSPSFTWRRTSGKKGPKLQEAIPDSDASGNKFLIGRIVSNHISMTTLATLFSRFTGQTVLDMTGLTGSYDLKLEWTPENTPASAAPGRGADAGASMDGDSGPSLFAAVEQQLGLAAFRPEYAIAGDDSVANEIRIEVLAHRSRKRVERLGLA